MLSKKKLIKIFNSTPKEIENIVNKMSEEDAKKLLSELLKQLVAKKEESKKLFE